MFGVSAYTVREWAKSGRLRGAKKVGRDWTFPLDVDYHDSTPVAAAPTAGLGLLANYRIGSGRAA
jgi:hypothetical protein